MATFSMLPKIKVVHFLRGFMLSNSQQTTVNTAQESHSKGLPLVQF